MKNLIKNQDIKFDTHQAGDGQAINIEALHMEKILHNPKGVKIKYHLFRDIEPIKVSRNIDDNILTRVNNEVKTAFKDKNKLKNFAQLIIEQMFRYKNNEMTLDDAIPGIKLIAKYFDLQDNILELLVKYSEVHIKEISVIVNDENENLYQIKQNEKETIIKNRKRL